MDKVFIVMPAYNELENLKLMIPDLFEKYFPEIKNAEMHLLIVNDLPISGDGDGSGDFIREEMKKYKNLHLLEGKKGGLGWAYVRGFREAMDLGADAVMEMDADFQHPPRFVKPMVEAYLNGADYVIGSRYIKGGSVPKEWAISRKAVSFFGNLFIRLVLLNFKIHDLTTGFRLSRVKGVLNKIDLEKLMDLDRFAYKVDLLYQSLKLSQKTVEVPLEFASRVKEKSKFNWKEMTATFKVAVVLGIKDKQKIIKFGIVGATGFVVNFIFLRIFRSLGLSEFLVWTFATELAIVNNFVFNNIWTFKDSTIKGIKALTLKFLQFNLTSAGALAIQSVAGPIGTWLIGTKYDYLVLAFVVLFLVLPYNYFMYTRVIWKKK
jgi:dolichol-phosphate mannosyltransferase